MQQDAVFKNLILRDMPNLLTRTERASFCPFCNDDAILQGIVTYSAKKTFFCMYNIRPVFFGHVLIIPMQHYSRFTDLNAEEAQEMILFQQQIITSLKQVYKTDSVNMLLQEGEHSGQSIAHLHMHIMPRQPKDVPNDEDWMQYFRKNEHIGKILSMEERQVQAQAIKSAMLQQQSNKQ